MLLTRLDALLNAFHTVNATVITSVLVETAFHSAPSCTRQLDFALEVTTVYTGSKLACATATMAPARKTRSVAKQPQHLIFKVTKPAVLNTKTASPSQRKLEAIESVTSAEVEQPHARVAQTQSTGVSRKRRRDTPSTSDSEGEASATQVQSPIKKVSPQADSAG